MARPQDRQRRPRVRLRPRKVERGRRPALERLEELLLLSYTVTNANDSGAGSLPFEINAANTAGVAATIDFNIPGSGPITIAVGKTSGAALPPIQVPLTLDGWSEGTFQGAANPTAHPWIVLDGSALTGATGLDVANGPGSVLQGLSVVRFGGDGIDVEAPSSGVLIRGDDIGVLADGATAAGNGGSGVTLNSSKATVGGTAAGAGDVIAANTQWGVVVTGGAASANVVQGDLIGTDAAGDAGLGNGFSGVLISGRSAATTVATSTIVASAAGDGVSIGGSDNNTISGDVIGLAPTASKALGNAYNGVSLYTDATYGETTGNLIQGDTIGGNAFNGVALNGASTSGNVVAGGFLGTNAAGAAGLGNGFQGVNIDGGASGNTVGGTTAAAANVLSGNAGDGVHIGGAGTTGNVVQGNSVGTDPTGAKALGNGNDGVLIDGGATGNAVGGGNLISGNGQNGVEINGATTSGNRVAGNLIGTDATGTVSVPNATWGVLVPDAPGNTVGGTSAGARNVISGNNQGGVAVYGPDASGNLVEGDFIGTDVTGTKPLGNAFSGVYVGDGTGFGPSFPGAPSHVTVGGSAAGAGNIIAANQNYGVWVAGGSADLIQGDFIGTDPAGDTGLGNQFSAVLLSGKSTGSTVDTSTLAGSVAGDGLTIAGSSGNTISHDSIGRTPASAVYNAYSGVSIFTDATYGQSTGNTLTGDTILGNLGDGVAISGAGTTGNVVTGSLIGTDSAGDAFVGNGGQGVDIYNGAASNSVVGSTISGNLGDGVRIDGAGGNTVSADVIGLAPSGTTALGNQQGGVDLFTDGNGVGATDNRVLDSTIAANGAQGSGYAGVIINGGGTTGNAVQGSLIGTDAAGDAGLGNHGGGVAIFGGAVGNTIGGAAVVATGRPTATILALGDTISGNTGNGVALFDAGTTGNVVGGDVIGLDPTGATALPNTGDGVLIESGASTNTVGGDTVSGNGVFGVQLTGAGVVANLVTNSEIGTDRAGTKAVGNTFSGVEIDSGASTNSVATDTISGNGGDGVTIVGAGNNSVTGSVIGLDSGGSVALGNAESGVSIFTDGNNVGAADNHIAGDTIAGNGGTAFSGVAISGAGTTGNVVAGDLVGTDAAGDAGLGNGNGGVAIFGGAAGNAITGSTLSGNTGGGAQISGAGTTGNLVSGSLIGLDPTGKTALPNTGDGVDLFAGATANTITGATISGNKGSGITPSGAGTSGNLFQGNTIGTDPAGAVAIPNAVDGIGAFGGTGPNTIRGNLVSGNTGAGISIADAGSDGYLITGNTVGTDATGTTALPNGTGLVVINGASNETIQGNLVSGNGGVGIDLNGGAGDLIAGNMVGTDATGTKAVPNAFQGIALFGVVNSTVGGSTAAARNLVSGNGDNGIVVAGASSSVLVRGNYAGTDVTGTKAVANGFAGIFVGSGAGFSPPPPGAATGVTVVGNLASGNGENGIVVDGVGVTGNVVAGNLIGTDPTGTKALPNTLDGVLVADGASGNTVGGTTAAAANVISGNDSFGIHLRDAGTSGNVVAGNLIGTDLTGTKPLGDGKQGILIDTGAIANTVGGTSAAAANVIAASALEGVRISDSGTTGNVVAGNFIGTNAAGATNLGNAGDGVAVVNLAGNNTVGGNAPGAGNVIADNGGNGVTIGSSKTDAVRGDSVLGNDIVANAKLGIDLADDGVTRNDSAGHAGPNLFQDFPVLSRVDSGPSGSFLQGSVSGPANSTLRVEFFLNSAADPSGYGQGQTYLGYVNVATDASGVGTFLYHVATALPVGQFVSATATDPSGNTSEFARDVQVTPAPAPSYSLTFGGFLYNRATKQFVQAVTLTNTGVDPILGPISLVLDSLTNGVTLVNATGTTTTGSPYINFNLGAGDELLPNQSVSLLLDFSDPSHAQIRYNSRLILGPGPR